MKHQALFSSNEENQEIRESSAAILLGCLRAKREREFKNSHKTYHKDKVSAAKFL